MPPALLGRLYTNLTETYCWSDPNRAVETVDRAVGIHSSLGNQIELAKCDAALGIALSRLGDDERARAVIAKSLRRAEDVGYLGGVSFALQARVVAEWLAADFDAAAGACQQLVAAVDDMDTYRHLQAVPFLLLGDDVGFARVVAGAEWLDGDSVEKRISAYMRSN